LKCIMQLTGREFDSEGLCDDICERFVVVLSLLLSLWSTSSQHVVLPLGHFNLGH
jgi:hypothetical protein